MLTLDYLATKLRQAEADVELFTVMIQEIKALQSEKTKLNTNNNFLKVIINEEKMND